MNQAEKLIKEYQATGRIAFYHPRNQTVSLDGYPAIPVRDAIKKMAGILGHSKTVCDRNRP